VRVRLAFRGTNQKQKPESSNVPTTEAEFFTMSAVQSGGLAGARVALRQQMEEMKDDMGLAEPVSAPRQRAVLKDWDSRRSPAPAEVASEPLSFADFMAETGT
jgi:hypothetical protein